jgi:hypothetical protein
MVSELTSGSDVRDRQHLAPIADAPGARAARCRAGDANPHQVPRPGSRRSGPTSRRPRLTRRPSFRPTPTSSVSTASSSLRSCTRIWWRAGRHHLRRRSGASCYPASTCGPQRQSGAAAAVVAVGVLSWRFAAGPEERSLPDASPWPPAVTPTAAPPTQPRQKGSPTLARLVMTAARGDCWLSVRAGSRDGGALYEGTFGGTRSASPASASGFAWARPGTSRPP